jgi:hypothetical protein
MPPTMPAGAAFREITHQQERAKRGQPEAGQDEQVVDDNGGHTHPVERRAGEAFCQHRV